MQRFKCNSMIANPDKFQITFLEIKNRNIRSNIDSNKVNCSNTVKLLGGAIDDGFAFILFFCICLDIPHLTNEQLTHHCTTS